MDSILETKEILRDPLKLGVGVLPPEGLAKEVIEMARQISEAYPLSYQLDQINFLPHVTLFQGNFDTINRVKMGVETALSQSVGPRDIKLEDVGLFAQNFVFLDCQKTSSLSALHNLVVDFVNPQRATEVASIGKEQNLSGLSSEEIQNLEDYGYPFVKEQFRPHLTLGRVTGNTLPSLDRLQKLLGPALVRLRNKSFNSSKLVIYKIGIDGANVGAIEEFGI